MVGGDTPSCPTSDPPAIDKYYKDQVGARSHVRVMKGIHPIRMKLELSMKGPA